MDELNEIINKSWLATVLTEKMQLGNERGAKGINLWSVLQPTGGKCGAIWLSLWIGPLSEHSEWFTRILFGSKRSGLGHTTSGLNGIEWRYDLRPFWPIKDTSKLLGCAPLLYGGMIKIICCLQVDSASWGRALQESWGQVVLLLSVFNVLQLQNSIFYVF